MVDKKNNQVNIYFLKTSVTIIILNSIGKHRGPGPSMQSISGQVLLLYTSTPGVSVTRCTCMYITLQSPITPFLKKKNNDKIGVYCHKAM